MLSDRQISLHFRVSASEKEYIEKLAKKDGYNTISDYIRARLLGDSSKYSSYAMKKHEKEMMQLLIRQNTYITEIARTKLSKERMDEFEKFINSWLEGRGYK